MEAFLIMNLFLKGHGQVRTSVPEVVRLLLEAGRRPAFVGAKLDEPLQANPLLAWNQAGNG